PPDTRARTRRRPGRPAPGTRARPGRSAGHWPWWNDPLLVAVRSSHTVRERMGEAMSLRVRVRDQEWVVDSASVVGRSVEAGVRCLAPWISGRHAALRPLPDGTGWELEDLDSAQGVWQGGERVRRVAISDVTHLTLGGPGGTPLTLEPLGPAVLRIGRAMDNDVTISDLSVSRHHAELVREAAGGWVLRDPGSSTGLLVDGPRGGLGPI